MSENLSELITRLKKVAIEPINQRRLQELIIDFETFDRAQSDGAEMIIVPTGRRPSYGIM